MTVEYRELPEYPGYRFGSDGSAWSQHRPFGKPRGEWRRLSGTMTAEGYTIVRLKITGSDQIDARMLHQLILEAFVGPRPRGCEACHNDGDKANNAATNLRWDTRSENMKDRVRHGGKWRRVPSETRKEIRRLHADGVGYRELGNRYQLSPRTIQSICMGHVHRPPVHRELSPFGLRLHAAIYARHRKMTAFVAAIGIGRSTIDEWCYLGKFPKTATLVTVAKHLGVSVDFLLGLTSDPVSTVPFKERADDDPIEAARLAHVESLVEMLGAAESIRRLNQPTNYRRPARRPAGRPAAATA